ncbi:sulfhydryl oxidase 1 isoform X3 [Heterodontus francisci]|uniref:sulfhydryl oxidase 1 isoform X3 n=1 Tax=Heterodontus francisci TaxID=7792 RepID=UPI00355B465A
MAQRWDAVFVSLAAISLLGTPGAVSGAGLYSQSDQVTLLDTDNFDEMLYNCSNAWLVEFYASWCGYCIDFAPVWKSLARDIKEWKTAVSLAVVNCANLKNAKLCQRFEVTTYPTIKSFKAFSKPFFKGEPFVDSDTTISALRHDIIRYLEQHGENVWPPACPPLEPARKMPTRTFYTYYLRRLPGVTRNAYKLTTQDSTHMTTVRPWSDLDSCKVYMADLESALYYSLKVEVGMHKELSGNTLAALKHFIAVLTKFFPGRPFVMKMLQITEAWLAKVGMAQISYNAYLDVLSNKQGRIGALLPDGVNWVGCRGSRPQFRGYPCSLWTLFHLLTVQAAKYNESMKRMGKTVQTDPLEVLYTLRQYVKYFFGCRECATHFEAMAEDSMDQVDSFDDAILWLWSRHNRVNNRLAGALSEDPKFPKLQWPPPDMCAECHSEVKGEHVWITDEILKFLKVHYSPENIDYSYLEGEQELLKKQKAREETQQDQEKDSPKEEEKVEGEEEDEEEERNEEPTTRNSKQREISKTITGIRRDGSQKRTFIMGKHSPRGEEDIVDLDSFVNEQYKSQALEDRAENKRANLMNEGVHGPQLHLQSIDDVESLGYAVLQSKLQKRGIGSRYLGAQAKAKKQNWLGLKGMSLSHTDISLCMLLYILTSLCLLSMYLYFRMRFRWRKWRNHFASA